MAHNVASEIELEGDIQKMPKIENGAQESELEGAEINDNSSPDVDFQMTEEKADLTGLLQVKNEKAEPVDDAQEIIEQIEPQLVIPEMSKITKSESDELEENDEKVRPEVYEQIQTNEEIRSPGNHKIRNSTPNLGVIIGEGNVLSRYLRAPVGSCHDLCKYGINHGHGSEAKDRSPFWKWLPARSRRGKDMEKVAISVEGQKKSTGPKPSPSLRNAKSNNSEIKEKSASPENSLLSFEENDASLQHSRDQKLESDKSKSSSFSAQKVSSSQTMIIESRNGSSGRKIIEGRNRTARKSVTGEMNFQPSIFPSSQRDSLRKTWTIIVKDGRNLKGSPHQVNLRNTKVIKPEQVCSENPHEKTLHGIECSTEKESPESTPGGVPKKLLPSSLASLNRSFKHVHINASKSVLPSSSRKSRVPAPDLPTSSKGSKTATSTLHPSSTESFRRAGSRFNPITSASSPSTKTLRPTQGKVHRARSPPASPSPLQSSLSMSQSSTCHSKRTGKLTVYNNGGQASKVVYIVRPRRAAVVASGNNPIAPRKLSFRRGRVIELPQTQINAPRRLKFRRPKPLGEIENAKTEYRVKVIGTKEVDQGESIATKIKSEKLVQTNQLLVVNKRGSLRKKEACDIESGDTKGVSEQIVLRHQMVEGKKNLQQLYNNVIEETATKLAETRKSKVKALVGAFETVISLEDSKPAAVTSAS